MLKLLLEGEVPWENFLEKGLCCFILKLYFSSMIPSHNNLEFYFYSIYNY